MGMGSVGLIKSKSRRNPYRLIMNWSPQSFTSEAFIGGLIGSAATWFVLKAIGFTVNSARWSIHISVSLAGGIAAFLIIAAVLIHRRHQRILNGAAALADLDQTLLGLLPQLAPSENRDAAMEKLLQAFLRDLIEVIGDELVFRAIIYRVEDDQLVPWVVWPSDYRASVAREFFYVGPNQKTKRGTAGEIFCTSGAASRVVHISKGKAGWTADDSSWIPPASGAKPKYRSFIVSKIYGTVEPSPWGVISIDSQYDDTFDAKEIRDLIDTIAIRLDSAMRLYRSLTDSSAP